MNDVGPFHHLHCQVGESQTDLNEDWSISRDGEDAEGGEEGGTKGDERGRVQFGDVVGDLEGEKRET